MARPLIQMALDSLSFEESKLRIDTFCLYVFDDSICPTIEYIRTPIPKPSKNMYQTKRGKWIICK